MTIYDILKVYQFKDIISFHMNLQKNLLNSQKMDIL
ncbi:unnamed protein product [Paramecium pentaurelia]|uniref:Uncharacterized protein n=1 Tax=Paramecium pentaurelia TaxID=43138 RepID=A0A8S1XV47_9CILI|nr:unnamed protein product [Paramecium pentaurelia]